MSYPSPIAAPLILPSRCHETVEQCDDQAEVGYTESYEPDLGYVYSEQYELEVLSGYDGDYINSSTGVNCSMFYNGKYVIMVQNFSRVETL